jgi:cytosine/adenosine deaminase-related metal-dependent hydrolase
MKQSVCGALFCLVASVALAQQAALPKFECDRSLLLLRGVDIWSPGGIDRRRDVLVVDGYINEVAASGRIKAPKGARVIKAEGQVMLPGFVDAHVHFVFPGPMGDRKAEPVADALTLGRQMLASGVTSARVHLDTMEHASLLLALSKDECAPMPRLQITGPGFIPGTGNNEKAAVWDVTGVDDAIAKVRREHEAGFQWIAIHEAHKFRDDARAAMVSTARQLGMRILGSGWTQPEVASSLKLLPDTLDYLDVSPALEYPEELLAGIRAQKQLTWVARIGVHERFRAYQENPKLIDDPENYELFDAATTEVLRQSVHKAVADRQSDHSKRMDGAYPTMARKFQQALKSGVPLAMGTDVGSPGQFHRNAIWWEIEAWMKHGATIDQAIEAGTRGGARALNDSRIGAVGNGARADFLVCPSQVLSARPVNFRDCRVFKGGQR